MFVWCEGVCFTKKEVLLEAVRCEEVEQVKQLLQVVLQWSSCEQKLVVDLVVVQTPEELETARRKLSFI